MQSLNRKSIVALIITLVLILGIAAGLYLVQRQQVLKSKAAESNKLIRGTDKMVIGFNVKGLTHYGYKDLFPLTDENDIDLTLQEINRLNGKIIRIYVGNNRVSDEETAERLDKLLTKADRYGISLLISLINFYEGGHNPKNSEYYYSKLIDPVFTRDSNGVKLLGDDFFNSDYTGRYFQFIKTIVEKNRYHNNIFAWELGNELKYTKKPNDLVAFIKETGGFIKSLYPADYPPPKISTGFLDAKHATNNQLSANELYPLISNSIDVISVTSYGADIHGLPDIQWAVRNGKIPIIMEGGFENRHGEPTSRGWDRSKKYAENINYWASQGVAAYLVWGFIRQGVTADNGDIDDRFGMDNVLKTDYPQIANVLLSYARKGSKPFQNLKLLRFDLTNIDTNETSYDNDALERRIIRLNYSKIFVREYYGETLADELEPRTYQLNLEDGDAVDIGNALVKINIQP